MKLQRTLAALVFAVPLIASAVAPSQAVGNAKRSERNVAAQIRDYVFGWTVEQAPKRPAERVRAAQPAPGTKAISLNGLAPEALDAVTGLKALADHPIGG